jgi:hypothetical protein
MLKTTLSGRPARLIGLGLTALLGLTVSMTASSSEHFFEYKGSEWCAECHIDRYSGWQGTAHGKMLMSCEASLSRAIPLPEGYTCDDISYVIGGNGQRALYLDNDGYLVTSIRDRDGNETAGHNQWNLGTGRWTDVHAGESGVPYDCGACHSTGWKQDKDPDIDGDLSDNQGGLPGIHGTFEYGGVGCEACHGPGFTMLVYEDAETCALCHGREPLTRVNAAEGFILNHQQYNEVLSSPHASFSCATCHNTHESGEAALRRTCETCHGSQAESYAGTKMQLAGVECMDCHMPKASLSGEALSPHQADVSTHLFRIRTGRFDQPMFTSDGSTVRTDNGGAAVNLDFACRSCHAGQSTAWLSANAEDFHNPSFSINGAMSGTWWAGFERDGEGWLIDAAANVFVAAMYTYDGAGNQAWLIGTGNADGDMVSTAVEITDGPAFGSGYNPDDVNRAAWGTANFLFTSCTEGTVELAPNADMLARGFENMTVNIERVTESAVSCPGPN